MSRAEAAADPFAIDKLLVAAGLASSLTEARRLIRDGSVYLNNVRLVPPEDGPDLHPVALAGQR